MEEELPVKVDREQRFIELLHENVPAVEAARKAGYSPSYARNVIARKLKDPKFISRLRDGYKDRKVLNLPVIDFIEASAIHEYIKDPKLAIKSPGLLKDLKTAAGIQQEELKQTTFINISNLRELSVHVLNKPPDQIEEAEVIND